MVKESLSSFYLWMWESLLIREQLPITGEAYPKCRLIRGFTWVFNARPDELVKPLHIERMKKLAAANPRLIRFLY